MAFVPAMKLTACTFHPLLGIMSLTICKRLAYCSVALSSHRCTYPCSLSGVLLNSKVCMTRFVWSTATLRTFDFQVFALPSTLHSCVPVQFCSCPCTGSILHLLFLHHHFSNIDLHTSRRRLTFFPACQSPYFRLSRLYPLPLGAPFSLCLLPGSSY